MELIRYLIDFVLHIDKHLLEIVTNYQFWTYLILFVIIFCETGLVVTPFLPGDSLLFAAGAIAAMEGNPINIAMLMISLSIAAILGDNVNYYIGRFLGHKVYDRDYKLIKKEHLLKTHAFYEKHGGKTIIIARFMPIIRTFAPFVAGVGEMSFKRFISFNIIGGILWVISFSAAGFLFGNIPAVKRNFTLVVFTIILISLLPMIYALISAKVSKQKNNKI
ncbi:MAG: DedA family protein [Bacteroidales bacterium]|nr:DedA family protein [Bacteroidales bacterium]